MSDQSLVQAGFSTPRRQNRWKVAFRYVLALPHLFWLLILGVAAFVLVVIGWFAALFMGRLPLGFARFLSNVIIYQTRVYSYLYLMNDDYPPFSARADFDVNVDIPVGRVRRFAVLFRYFLLIPAGIVNALVAVGLGVFSFIIWLVVLIKGSMPPSLFAAISAILRFQARTSAYATMITGKYPGELFGEKPNPSGDPARSPEELPPPPTSPAQQGVDMVVADKPATDFVTFAVADEDRVTDRANAAYTSATFTTSESVSNSAQHSRTAGLILGRGAKVILVIFLIVGGLGYAGELVIGITHSSSQSSLISLENANSILGSQITTAKAHDKTCSLSQSVCAEQYLNTLAIDFGQFRASVAGISFPSSANADAARLDADSVSLVSLLDQMTSGTATTQTQLNRLQTLANTFDADYARVVADLTRSSL